MDCGRPLRHQHRPRRQPHHPRTPHRSHHHHQTDQNLARHPRGLGNALRCRQRRPVHATARACPCPRDGDGSRAPYMRTNEAGEYACEVQRVEARGPDAAADAGAAY